MMWKKSGGETSVTSVRIGGLWAEIQNVDLLNIGQPLKILAVGWRKHMRAVLRWYSGHVEHRKGSETVTLGLIWGRRFESGRSHR